jgi:hypothetical protein
MGDDFSAEVKDFIGQNIESLAQLELLLLVRQHAGIIWSVDDAAKALSITSAMAAELLADLVRRGFVVQNDSGFRYQTAGAVDQMVAQLAELYRSRRVAVTTEIYSKPVNKVQTFADAFRFRREK